MPLAFGAGLKTTRQSTRNVLAAFVVLSVLVSADARAGDLPGTSTDRIVASAVIPDAVRRVGQVRLLARGETVVVQTLLSTKLLARVIAEIRKKEEKNWPPDDAAMLSYLAALDAARERVEKRDSGPAWSDRRRRLLIEFTADASSQAVLVGTFEFAADGEEALPASREIFSTLDLPRAYVLRNLRLVLADSFKIPEGDVDRLGPLGPAAKAALPPSGAAAK